VSVDAVASRLNPAVAWVLRSPFHWLLSPGLMLLSYTGCVSGRRIAIPVGFQRTGDRVTIMVSEAPRKRWWRNFREPRTVSLLIRGRTRDGCASLVSPGSPAFRDAAERTLRPVPGMGRVFKVDFDRRTGLTPEQIDHLAQEVAVVVVELDLAD